MLTSCSAHASDSRQANCGIPEGGKGNFTLAVQAAVLGDWGVIKHQRGHLSQWTKVCGVSP